MPRKSVPASVRRATTVGTSTGRQVRLDRAADVGEPALFVEETPITSGGGQSSTIQCSSTQRVPAPERHATATAAVAGRRAGRAAVGARRPVRDAGRRRHLAPCRQDPPVRRARLARAPRALLSGALHARSVHREHPQSRPSDAQPRADRRARAPEDPVRSSRCDRGARRGGRTAVPARRRARRGQDDRRGPRGDGGGRPPRCATGARRGRPARRDHDRPLVPHDHGAGATAVWSGS